MKNNDINHNKSRLVHKVMIGSMSLSLILSVVIFAYLHTSWWDTPKNFPNDNYLSLVPAKTSKPVTTTPPRKPAKTVSPPTEDATHETTPEQPPIISNPTVLFSDSVFIGDSRTEGLSLKTGLKSADFITYRGLNVRDCFSKECIDSKDGAKVTVMEKLKEKQYQKVFIMFGINELGWPNLNAFINKYKELISAIKTIQPEATIYVQSILYVSKEKSESDPIYNNKRIDQFTQAIELMCTEQGISYLDINTPVFDDHKFLPADGSTDGVHLNKTYCLKWLDYLTDVITS